MNSRLRMAVAFFFFKENNQNSFRLRLGEACYLEEILLVLALRRYFATAKLLPDKIQEKEKIGLICSGSKSQFPVITDEQGQNPDGDNDFVNAPIFNWNDGKLHFNTNWTNNANKQYGSVSGFLPKYLLKKTS